MPAQIRYDTCMVNTRTNMNFAVGKSLRGLALTCSTALLHRSLAILADGEAFLLEFDTFPKRRYILNRKMVDFRKLLGVNNEENFPEADFPLDI